jgi:hypothetical protein
MSGPRQITIDAAVALRLLQPAVADDEVLVGAHLEDYGRTLVLTFESRREEFPRFAEKPGGEC